MDEFARNNTRLLEVNGCDHLTRGEMCKMKEEEEDDDDDDVSEKTAGPDEEYDPYRWISSAHPTSYLGVIVHIFVVAASPTLMNVPATFRTVGYLVGTVGCFLTVIFYAASMHTIIAVEYRLSRQLRKPSLSYAQVMYYSFERAPNVLRSLAGFVKHLVHVNFVCIWSGGNSIYVILACENIKSIHRYVYDADISTRQVIIFLSIPLVILCWIPNLRLMVICSAVANVLNVTCIAAIVYASLIDLPPLRTRTMVGKISSAPIFLGTLLVTLNATALMIPLKNELSEPRRFASTFGVLNVSYLPVGILCSIFGFVCYAKYGNNIEDNVVLNMRDTDMGNLITVLYTVVIVCMYPLVSYITYDTLWNNALKGKMKRMQLYSVYRFSFRTANAMSSIVFAYLVPDVKLFVSLTGTVGTSLDSIILPAVAEILVEDDVGGGSRDGRKTNNNRPWRLWKNVISILFGAVLCVFGLLDSLAFLMADSRYIPG